MDSSKGSIPVATDDVVDEMSDLELAAKVQRENYVVQDGNTKQEDMIRLWDLVDDTWTSPMHRRDVYERQLKKVVDKCTACTFSNGARATLGHGHVEQVLENAARHRKVRECIQAVPDGNGGTTDTCVVCKKSFRARPWDAFTHRDEILKKGEQHQGAEMVLTKRYALEPPVETHKPQLVQASTEPMAVSPERMQESGSQRKRKRKRPRRRNREVANAN